MKIGQLVKSYLPLIIDYCQTHKPEEVVKLQNDQYSKNTLGINFPFLIRTNHPSLKEDSKRYWTKIYLINNKEFRACSQWYEPQRGKFLDYIKSINILDSLKYIELKEESKKHVKENKNKQNSLKTEKLSTSNGLVQEAFEMSKHYNKFYFLERSLRTLIEKVMLSNYGSLWWSEIDERVKRNVDNNLAYELDTTHTKRSNKKIDYTSFGDLRKIINNHWSIFETQFNRNLNSVNEVLIDLNRIRASIAHCTPLVKKEVTRFELRLDDWKNILIEEPINTHLSKNKNNRGETSQITKDNETKFTVILGQKYYHDGFFNVRVKYSELFGPDSSKIKIQLGSNPLNYTIGKINRTANSNETPRIFAGALYKKWIQAHFNQGDIFRVEVIEKNFIKLSQEKD